MDRSPVSAPLTLTAYAARRGCSVKSVSRAVATGRLVDSVGRDEHDRPTIIDPELADREWEENTRGRSSPVVASERRDTPTQQSGGGNHGEPVVSAGANPAPDTERARRGGRPDLPDGVPAYNVSQAVRAHAAARREIAQADLAELELASTRGRLVDSAAARADVQQAYSLVKTRLMRVPSATAQQLPDLAARVVPVVEALITEALAELADGRPE